MSELSGRSCDRLERRLGPIAGGPRPLEGGITNRNYRVHLRRLRLRRAAARQGHLAARNQPQRRADRERGRRGARDRAGGARRRRRVPGHGVRARRAGRRATPLRASPEPVGAGAARVPRLGRAARRSASGCRSCSSDYAAIVRERGGSVPERYGGARPARAADRRGAAAERARSRATTTCCPANVLPVGDDGAILLVDWEYAGMGHRLFDLGNLAVNCEFDDAAEVRLLTAYFGEPPSAGPRSPALRLMRIMSDAREAAWGVDPGRDLRARFRLRRLCGRALRAARARCVRASDSRSGSDAAAA